MGLGKQIRMNRLFAHPSGRMCSVAVDHYIGYGGALPEPLRKINSTIAAVVAGQPDAITMHKGIAAACWEPYAGKIPLILQSVIARPDDTAWEYVTHVEEAVRLGAEAIATAAFIRGGSEAPHLRLIADVVREAAPYDLPVIVHIYPRVIDQDDVANASDFAHGAAVSLTPEDIAWAVHCALELGVDLIKVPYCGDIASFRDIVEECPRPIVIAGGPKMPTLAAALASTRDAMIAGAKGATVGRNIWGNPNPQMAMRAFSAVIHDLATPEMALRQED